MIGTSGGKRKVGALYDDGWSRAGRLDSISARI